MRRPKGRITIIDFLMILALLLIVAGMFSPHFARKSAGPGGAPAENPALMSHPPR